MGLFGGLLGGIFGGGSSSSSSSTVNSNVTVDVQNVIDNTDAAKLIGAALLDVEASQADTAAKQAQALKDATNSTNQTNAAIAAANILQEQENVNILTEKLGTYINKFGKAALILGVSYFAIRTVGKK